MGLINKVDMVCLSPVGYGVKLTFRTLALEWFFSFFTQIQVLFLSLQTYF